MKAVVSVSVLLMFIFLVGYYESKSRASSRSVPGIKDEALPSDYVSDEKAEIDDTPDTSFIFQLARFLAVASVVLGLFRLAYPDHLRV